MSYIQISAQSAVAAFKNLNAQGGHPVVEMRLRSTMIRRSQYQISKDCRRQLVRRLISIPIAVFSYSRASPLVHHAASKIYAGVLIDEAKGYLPPFLCKEVPEESL